MRWLRLGAAIAVCASGAGAIACSDGESTEASSQGSAIEDRADLFDSSTPIEVKVSAPLTQLFARLAKREADPPDPSKDGGKAKSPWGVQGDYSEPARVSVRDSDGKGTPKTFDARIYTRGESSETDCPFPKLKIEFSDKAQLKGTLFKGHSSIRVNTHCGPGDANTTSHMGRIQNGVGPVREELIYRMIRAADVPTYLTRVGKMTYEDTSGGQQNAETFAMLFESGDDAAQRFAKLGLIEPEGEYLNVWANEITGQATPENLAKIAVVEGLAGNVDFFGTHNVDSFGIPYAPTTFQIPEDFDQCAITTANSPMWSGDVAAASTGLKTAGIPEHFVAHRADMEAALRKAEQEGVAAGALPSQDGKTTTDPGFKIARDRLAQLFALPEFNGAAPQQPAPPKPL